MYNLTYKRQISVSIVKELAKLQLSFYYFICYNHFS